jgi:hypothetical protein
MIVRHGALRQLSQLRRGFLPAISRCFSVEPGALEHHHIHDPKLKEVYLPPAELTKTALLNSTEEYTRLHRHSITSPEEFWDPIARSFQWEQQVGSRLLRDRVRK